MSEETKVDDYILPAALIGRADLARLVRELESVDSKLQAQKVRDGEAEPHLPDLSESLSDFLEQNKLDITDGKALMDLKAHLQQLKDHAPVVHMTFAVEADPDSLQQLAKWFRQEAHPHTLLSVGLQPSLVGGVYMRTPNHVHDFSLKSLLKGKRDIIVHELEGLYGR